MHKTLVILTPGFPKDENDSTCIPARQIFVGVLKETYPDLDIIVLTFQYPFYQGTYIWNGVTVTAIGGKEKGRMFRVVTWLHIWAKLRKLNKQKKIIGLLSFWLGECAFVANMFSKRNKLKHYCWLLGQDAKAGNKYVKWIKPEGDNLIALSDFITTEFNKNYGITPKHLIPGAVDVSLFKPPPDKKDIDIMGAGSLIPLKQYDIFIDIIGSLVKIFPQIKAVLCGKGPERQLLEARVKELGLEENLKLSGELPHADVLLSMQRSKVFLHTSNYEGFGLVCLEALYAGAKVVSFVRPMNMDINNWHIAEDKQTMQQLVINILTEKNAKYYSVLPYLVHDNANILMKLFD